LIVVCWFVVTTRSGLRFGCRLGSPFVLVRVWLPCRLPSLRYVVRLRSPLLFFVTFSRCRLVGYLCYLLFGRLVVGHVLFGSAVRLRFICGPLLFVVLVGLLFGSFGSLVGWFWVPSYGWFLRFRRGWLPVVRYVHACILGYTRWFWLFVAYVTFALRFPHTLFALTDRVRVTLHWFTHVAGCLLFWIC